MPKPRKRPDLTPARTLRIFCEGAKTEPNYLNGYIGVLPNSHRKSVIEIEPTRKNTPVQLVEEAIRFKQSPRSIETDVFWVVYDRESVAKYSDGLHEKAWVKAQANGIKIALCNVCFEFWLLLHFVDTTAPYGSFDDLIKNSALNSEVKKECGADYEKSARFIFDALKGRVAEARSRGARLNSSALRNAAAGKDKPHQMNPYVGVVDLLEAIDQFV